MNEQTSGAPTIISSSEILACLKAFLNFAAYSSATAAIGHEGKSNWQQIVSNQNLNGLHYMLELRSVLKL